MSVCRAKLCFTPSIKFLVGISLCPLGAETCPPAPAPKLCTHHPAFDDTLSSSLILCCLQTKCHGEDSPHPHGEGRMPHPQLGSRYRGLPFQRFTRHPRPQSPSFLSSSISHKPSPTEAWLPLGIAGGALLSRPWELWSVSSGRRFPPLHVSLGEKVSGF